MGAQWSQFFPPNPTFTEADVESQDGRVFLITGGSSGIGFELAKMLYRKNGRVYIAGRSDSKLRQAIEDIQHDFTSAKGSIRFLHLELDDLTSIKAAVEAFKAEESKLHVLWNNAGVSQPPLGSVSKQGVELQLATNCLGPFLLTQMLLPTLITTAADKSSPPGSVRVVWSSSQMVELSAPLQGINIDEFYNPPEDKGRNYVNSKTANMFLASELARRHGTSDAIISVAQNPGAVSSNLFRYTPLLKYLAWPLLHKPALGANTALYAGLSKHITLDTNGCYVIPWGRIATQVRQDLLDAMRLENDGGSGRAKLLWDFCSQRTRDYF